MVKCLLCTLEFDAQNPGKKLGMVTHGGNTGARETDTGRSLGFTGQQPSLFGKAGSMTDPISKK